MSLESDRLNPLAEENERLRQRIAELEADRDAFSEAMRHWHEEASRLASKLEGAERERDEVREAKDGAYAERNRLVAALSALYPSHLQRHPDEDEEWEDGWRWIVFVELPTGQATWHIHDSELPWFDHLLRLNAEPVAWDGHTAEEKYRRLAAVREGEK